MQGDEETLDKIVFQYLHKRGYKTADTFKLEANITTPQALNKVDENTSILNYVLFYNQDEINNPSKYSSSYSKLSRWVDDSINLYKLELRRILFPCFVHCYLDLVQRHHPDLATDFFLKYGPDHYEDYAAIMQRLSHIKLLVHLSDNELAQSFRLNKYSVSMSKYSFELLLSFLQDNKYMLILRLMNQYITISATADKPGQVSGKENACGLIGIDEQANTFNDQVITLGEVQKDLEFYGDVERALAVQDHDDGPELLEDVKHILSSPITSDQPAQSVVPLPPLKMADVDRELGKLRDLRHRIELDDKTLPSICFYTFHNTTDNLNCLKASRNANYIAGGFGDSFIKLWSVESTKPGIDAQSSTDLIGHSAAIFNLDFSPDDNYLISASEDKTVRLWSLETKTNLVCYKGHNYPIFDVSFAHQGFYFATASLDRTARLWSCDHIFPLRLFVGHLSDVNTVRFHPNCNYLVTGSDDKSCRMWDIQSGECVRIFGGHDGPVTSVCVSPSGKQMASSDSSTIKVWDLGSGNLIDTFVGHQAVVHDLTFSNNGGILASAGDDDCIKIWDTQSKKETKECIKSFPTKRSSVYSVSFTNRNIMIGLGVYSPL